MTRNEKIGLLENYSTFLAANGYMDEDWRSEPPYAIDEFLKLTEDKKAPQDKIELIFVGIETMMFSAFLQGKENGQFKNWYERNGMKDAFKRTIEEYMELKKDS